MKISIYLIFFFLILLNSQIDAQPLVIDKFDNLTEWKEIVSDGAKIKLEIQKGLSGDGLRIDYEFLGAGYCGVEKLFPFNLPHNYKFRFYLKGNSPKNNLEFKLVDKSGDNVWWRNQRNFDFPTDWEKITIKKRDIEWIVRTALFSHFRKKQGEEQDLGVGGQESGTKNQEPES